LDRLRENKYFTFLKFSWQKNCSFPFYFSLLLVDTSTARGLVDFGEKKFFRRLFVAVEPTRVSKIAPRAENRLYFFEATSSPGSGVCCQVERATKGVSHLLLLKGSRI
jgi:hypothetical protein